jgi:hypothetical protein
VPQNLISGPTHSNSNTQPRYRSSGLVQLPTAQGATNTAGTSTHPATPFNWSPHVTDWLGHVRVSALGFTIPRLARQPGPLAASSAVSSMRLSPLVHSVPQTQALSFFSMFLGGSGFPSLVLSILRHITHFALRTVGGSAGLHVAKEPDVANQLGRGNSSQLFSLLVNPSFDCRPRLQKNQSDFFTTIA